MMVFLYLMFFLLFVVLHGFFSGSEIAMIAANAKSIRKSTSLSTQRIKTTLKLLKNRERLLATTLCGSTLFGVANAILGTVFFLFLSEKLETVYALIILFPILLIGGELIPRTLFQLRANALAPRISYPLWITSCCLFPLYLIVQKTSHLIFLLAG
ncbi:MAG: DUF21 domain-containing protein, partial [Thermodesulfobacteriota bacterium]|nr:DUF21 domain-containing protein [Thermodesulfobacteriota bacterium]